MTFGWMGDGIDPTARWDLRLCGWALCRRCFEDGAACPHPLLIDAGSLTRAERKERIAADPRVQRLILLGVEESSERARLLAFGCADVLPAATGLLELEARARRAAESLEMLPRRRRVGPLTLDLFHRDARSGQSWLNLHPREFGLLWRLSNCPGKRVTRRELLRDVWRIHHEPETNSVEVHVSRLRSKLAGAGCEALIETASEGGYRLAPPVSAAEPSGSPQWTALDPRLRHTAFSPIAEAHADEA